MEEGRGKEWNGKAIYSAHGACVVAPLELALGMLEMCGWDVQ